MILVIQSKKRMPRISQRHRADTCTLGGGGDKGPLCHGEFQSKLGYMTDLKVKVGHKDTFVKCLQHN